MRGLLFEDPIQVIESLFIVRYKPDLELLADLAEVLFVVFDLLLNDGFLLITHLDFEVIEVVTEIEYPVGNNAFRDTLLSPAVK